MRLEAGEQGQRGLGRGDTAQRDGGLLRLWREFQHGGGDDPQRALGADEQLAQAVAGVVLAQPAQTVPDRAVGQHHLQPQHQVARIAVTHRVVAAGVDRQHAADLRGALGRNRQRQQAAGFGGGKLGGLQGDAGLDRQRHVHRVEVADTVQASGAEHKFRAVLGRDRAADHGGVAALRHHRCAGLGAQLDHRGEFLRRGGTDHRAGAALVQAAPVR